MYLHCVLDWFSCCIIAYLILEICSVQLHFLLLHDDWNMIMIKWNFAYFFNLDLYGLELSLYSIWYYWVNGALSSLNSPWYLWSHLCFHLPPELNFYSVFTCSVWNVKVIMMTCHSLCMCRQWTAICYWSGERRWCQQLLAGSREIRPSVSARGRNQVWSGHPNHTHEDWPKPPHTSL